MSEKYCKDCVHYKQGTNTLNDECKRREVIVDLVRGVPTPIYAMSERFPFDTKYDHGNCGREAKFFSPKVSRKVPSTSETISSKRKRWF